MFGKDIPAPRFVKFIPPYGVHSFTYGRFTPRLTAAFGEEGIRYRYAGMDRETITEWPEALLKVKKLIEEHRGIKLNYAFVNIYEIEHNDKPAKHYIGWHSDKEADIVCDDTGATTIASISLGDKREFQLQPMKRIKKDTRSPVTGPLPLYSKVLGHGSLATMEMHTQKLFKHRVPPKPSAKRPRINVTFRQMRKKRKK